MHIVLATYNLWNMMFHWSIRKHYIAEMISDANIDIIALQEVCGDIKQYRSQINDLQELLPVYQYTYISYAKKNNQNPFCEMEGLGILSKHKITNMFSMNLSRSLSSSDMNNRVALHLQFSIQPGDYELALIVVHFSTDRQQQCENVVELIKYIYAVGGENMVILGDFNAYQDFTWPVNALMNGKFSKEAPMSCRRKGIIFDTEQYRGYGYLFSDVWKSIYPKYSGLTFSNMPTPGFINRPDRILVSNSGLKVLSTVLMGRGQRYALKYVNSLWWERLRIIYKSMYFNQEPSQCAGTCGPHGSCRCGVCISGGNNNACADHFCTECSIQKFLIIHFALFIFVASFLFLFISLVSKLLRRKFFLTFCFSRSNLQFLHRNYVIFFALIICICSCMCLEVILKDILLLVDAQLPEELHPSDHLMVIAKINLL